MPRYMPGFSAVFPRQQPLEHVNREWATGHTSALKRLAIIDYKVEKLNAVTAYHISISPG